ncbi:MAG: hypothetical protein LBC04_03425 [Holosporaceae bacterium]|nr:hypothetical protein [Holosporaceae bacterium]
MQQGPRTRYRNGEFNSKIVKKRQSDIFGVEDLISLRTVSDVKELQSRPLKATYAVVGRRLKSRRRRSCKNAPPTLASEWIWSKGGFESGAVESSNGSRRRMKTRGVQTVFGGHR